MSLQSEIDALHCIASELLCLGLDGEPIYADHFQQLNADVYNYAEALSCEHGSTSEEEASLCVALLAAYNATIYNNGDKEEKIQVILERSWKVLEHLKSSLLKCQLLVACYGEVFDRELAQEARAIMDSWESRKLTDEEREVVVQLKALEENPYPWDEMGEKA